MHVWARSLAVVEPIKLRSLPDRAIRKLALLDLPTTSTCHAPRREELALHQLAKPCSLFAFMQGDTTLSLLTYILLQCLIPGSCCSLSSAGFGTQTLQSLLRQSRMTAGKMKFYTSTAREQEMIDYDRGSCQFFYSDTVPYMRSYIYWTHFWGIALLRGATAWCYNGLAHTSGDILRFTTLPQHAYVGRYCT